jgi:beta-glucanase (GH16 family)
MRKSKGASPQFMRPKWSVRSGRSAAVLVGERRTFALKLSLALACGAFTLPLAGASDAAAAPTAADPTAGLSLAFNPHFGGKKLNTSTWSTCYPANECNNYGNSNEIEWYRPSGAVVSGGTLHLVATQKPTRGTDSTGAPKTYPYTSGMVTTKKSFAFTYGYVQVVAQIPATDGTWPALWLLPKTVKWPPEIDIMENFGVPNAIATTYHWGTTKQPHQAARTLTTSTSLAGGYHTYGLLWEPGSITWYFDGKVVYTFTGKAVPSQSMYFLANLAINGPASSGSSFDIRSVKIYK